MKIPVRDLRVKRFQLIFVSCLRYECIWYGFSLKWKLKNGLWCECKGLKMWKAKCRKDPENDLRLSIYLFCFFGSFKSEATDHKFTGDLILTGDWVERFEKFSSFSFSANIFFQFYKNVNYWSVWCFPKIRARPRTFQWHSTTEKDEKKEGKKLFLTQSLNICSFC